MMSSNYSQEKDEGMLNKVLLSKAGWSPTLWENVKQAHPTKAVFFDLTDAIFDLILLTRMMCYGEDVRGGLGIYCL